MIEIKLNGAKMVDKASTHNYLKEKLGFPDFYGDNLDALWDCLSTDFSSKKIIIFNSKSIILNLGYYGEVLIKLFQKVAIENEAIQVIIEE